MSPTTLFDAGPGGRCGHQSPTEIGDHNCEREPGHPGHLHWARGPRSTVDPMWRTWTVDWRSE
jgi:hypothetical protein